MLKLTFNLSKKIFFLDLILYLFPISILVGTFFLNILTSISSIIFIFLCATSKIKFDNKYINIVFYILCLFLILNNIFSIDNRVTFLSSLTVLKSFFFFCAICYCFVNIKNFEKNFLLIFLLVLIFVILDTYYQHFFEKDIFGYPVNYSNGRRLSGPFGYEYIVGAFLSKIFFISLLALTDFKKNFFFNLLILITFPLVILSNERSASIMFLSGIIIYFLFSKISIKKKLLSFSLIIFFLISLFSINNNLKNHFISIPIKYFKDNHHKAHFLTAIEIFKNNVVAGSGLRTFRIECKKKKYENINTKYKNNRCTTHPHNIYLEILSETGLIGFVLILILICYINFFLIKSFFTIKNSSIKLEILIIFSNFFILFWPLQTTGSFFSSFNSTFYIIFFSIFFGKRYKIINNNYL